jgi:hypothetical protein
MADCSHDTFESLVTVTLVTPEALTPYHQACLQIRCAECGGPFLVSGLPPFNPTYFVTVAIGAGGSAVYLAGTVTPPSPPQEGQPSPPQEGQAWTRVVMPESPPQG